MSVIIGVDPGSLHTGYGLLEARDGRLIPLSHGAIHLNPQSSLSDRLAVLMAEMTRLIEQYAPNHLAIEKVFLGKNADSAFKLGHARGVVMALAAARGIHVHEYATRHVKKVMTGQGGATKEQVEFMVRQELGTQVTSLDASDALALAICLGRELEIAERFAGQNKGLEI